MASYRQTPTRAGTVPVFDARSLSDAPFTLRPIASPKRMRSSGAYGRTGTEIQSGLIINEEFNPELSGKAGVRQWDIMRRTEPQISSTLRMIALPIQSAQWNFVPGSGDPLDIEKASFAETNLFHETKRSWKHDLLPHAMLHLVYGFMMFEPIFRVDPTTGHTMLDDLAPRLPRTLNRWITDSDGELTAVEQWLWANNKYEYLTIPSENLVLMTNQQEGNNYEGISLLRSAYKAYWYKQNFERIQAVGYEREHVGIPVLSLPEGFTEEDRQRADKIGKNIRSNENSFVTLAPGWQIEWFKSNGGSRGRGGSIQETLYYLDRQMQQNVLAQFMSLGTTDVGSYALSNDQSRLFLMSLQATARYIADVLDKHVIRKLIDYNYPQTDVYPLIDPQKIHAYNFMDLMTAIDNAVVTGIIPVTTELEDFTYDLLAIPVPPRNPVEAMNGATEDVAGAVDPATGQVATPPRGTPVVRPMNIAAPGSQTDPSAGGIGYHEVYRDRHMTLSGTQAQVYARMAANAGRPRTEIRFPNGHQVLSAPKPQSRHDSLLARRARISEEALKQVEGEYDDLRAELESLLEAN